MLKAALLIEVVAGLIPNEPLPEYTKHWSLTHEQFKDVDIHRQVLGDATLYMLALQDPVRVNWVRLEWIWV